MAPQLGSHLASDFTGLDLLVQKGIESALRILPALRDSIAVRQREEFDVEAQAPHALLHIGNVRLVGDTLPSGQLELLQNLFAGKTVTILHIRKAVSELYAMGDFRDIYAELEFRDSVFAMTIHVVPHPVVHAVRLDGSTLIPVEELMPFFAPLEGNRLNSLRSRRSMEQLLSHYRDNGYSLARILRTEFDTASGILTVAIDEGAITTMSIEGTKKTRNWVIWREMVMNDRDVFTVAKANQSIDNVNATGLFDQILLEIRYVDNHPRIIVKTTERQSELIRLGARYDNERNLQSSLELRDDNFLGTATEIGTSLAGGLRNLKYVIEARANRILNSFFTFSVTGYYHARNIFVYGNDPAIQSATKFGRLRVGEYDQAQYGGVFSLGKQVERLGNFTVEYRFEATHVASLSGLSLGAEELTLQAFRVNSTVDTQDKLPFPSSGSLMTISYEIATSRVAGDIGYSKIFFSYEWFDTFFKRHTLHPKFVFGFADETLPLSQQFSLGGENSFYGLAEEDSRGRQLFLLNVEYRFFFPFRLVWDTYLTVRYDLGSIWPTQSAIRLVDFHHGIGAGFGLDTPIGPARLSIGRSFFFRRDLLNQPVSLGPIMGYFSVGYEF
ncbi:MAG: BamA/TamA family outer membrane protein [Ignavibacteriales bacterium]|nr:BamA/TamA family outer membrane protein [Ignavibacteriales bacterium]